MAIKDFEKLLEQVLNGDAGALKEWNNHTVGKQFDKKEIAQAWKAFNAHMLAGTPELSTAVRRSNALYLQGLWFNKGIGVPINKQKAEQCFKDSSDLGNPFAKTSLAIIYHDKATKIENNPSEDDIKLFDNALKLLDEAIKHGDPVAMTYKASMYLRGEIPVKDYVISFKNARSGLIDNISEGNKKTALKLLDDAIKKGDSNALFEKGNLYSLEGDKSKAIRLYDKAIKLGNKDALVPKAWIHQQQKEYANAILLYDDAIKLGDKRAMKLRADLYFSGEGETEQNYHKALRLYRDAYSLNPNYTELIQIGVIRYTENFIANFEAHLHEYSDDAQSKAQQHIKKIIDYENEFISKYYDDTLKSEDLREARQEFQDNTAKEMEQLKDVLWYDLSPMEQLGNVIVGVVNFIILFVTLGTISNVFNYQRAAYNMTRQGLKDIHRADYFLPDKFGITEIIHEALEKSQEPDTDEVTKKYAKALAHLSKASDSEDENIKKAENWVKQYNENPDTIDSDSTLKDLGATCSGLCSLVKDPVIIKAMFKNEALMNRVEKEGGLGDLIQLNKKIYNEVHQVGDTQHEKPESSKDNTEAFPLK